MVLNINTTEKGLIKIAIEDGVKKIEESEKVDNNHSEKLLMLIENTLEKNNYTLEDIEKISVVSKGGSFTSLRVGVLTANALAYALNIPAVSSDDGKIIDFSDFQVVDPEYDKDPNIGVSKKKPL
jgi:tRNA A37 threonylcarbamoyladenosine modification protein TsaB